MRPPRLTVAVCSNRAARQVKPALQALAEQLPEVEDARGVLVASGLGPAPAAELEELARRHGLAFRRAGTGLSVARNAALDGLGDEDVIAYVDDDAIPEPGWLERLAARWADAPPDVACIGGAIDPRWEVPPPTWMSDRVHIAFSVLDRGAGVKPLRPGVEDAWGANVSFRVGPLRRAGCFDPALGPVGGIPYFADETEAQRRLAAAGYRGLYAGDVRVRHVIGAGRMRLREVARRRFYAGSGMRAAGQWGAGDGLARLLAGAGGMALAALRRRPADLAAALSRASAGLGVLAGPLVQLHLDRLRRAG